MTFAQAMEQHALAILGNSYVWWPITKGIQQGVDFKAIAPQFLSHLIRESQRFGGGVLGEFWTQYGKCDDQLKENIEALKNETFVSAQRSVEVLFRGLDPEKMDFRHVLEMAARFFTHLGIAFMNPGGSKSGTGTGYSISDALKENKDTLEQQAKGGGKGRKEPSRRQQVSLKALATKRDGDTCLLTGEVLEYLHLAHIIPHSAGKKSETLDCIATFAGYKEVEDQLNRMGNVLNMQSDAHRSYDQLKWGIEAEYKGGEVKYSFRVVSRPNHNPVMPKSIAMKDGEEIQFGNGPEGKEIEKPIPRLCNLHLAVARVFQMSAAVDLVSKWLHDADDEGYSDLWIASQEDLAMLDAKLFLSGRAAVT